MHIATVTRTKYRPGTNKVDYKLVKGEMVTPATLRKISEADKLAWTRKVEKDASVNRRIIGRQNALEQLGIYSDVNLEVLKFLSNNMTNTELLAKRQGQVGLVKRYERLVFEHFGFDNRRIELELTDDVAPWTEASVWICWPLDHYEADMVAEFLEQHGL